MFLKSLGTKVAALLVKDGLRAFKDRLDPDTVGATPFLGLTKPVLKAHGASGARAMENAVYQAVGRGGGGRGRGHRRPHRPHAPRPVGNLPVEWENRRLAIDSPGEKFYHANEPPTIPLGKEGEKCRIFLSGCSYTYIY